MLSRPFTAVLWKRLHPGRLCIGWGPRNLPIFSSISLYLSTFPSASQQSKVVKEWPAKLVSNGAISNVDADELLKNLEKAMMDNDMVRIEQAIEAFHQRFPKGRNANFMNKAIEAFMRASRLDRAKTFYLAIVNDGFVPDERTIVVLLDGFLRHSDITHAKELMRSLDAFNLKPTIKTVNVWIAYYLKEQQLEKARGLFKSLEAQGLRPNLMTFLNFMKFFLRNSDFVSANRLKAFIKTQDYIKLDVSYYNALLKILFQKQALVEIDELLVEMKATRIKANADTFNVLIEGYASINMLDKAQELIREMPEHGFQPTIMTFNRLLASQAYALDVEQTRDILLQMNQLGLVFNAYTYVSLFKGLLAKQKYQEAISMLFNMDDNRVYIPVEVFSSLVKLCCDHDLDPAIYLLRTRLVKLSLSPSSHVYTSLIKYYLRHRNYKQVDGLLLEMQRRNNMKPSLHVLCTLLNHFVEHLDIERIGQILHQMKILKLELNKVVYNVVMKAFYVHCKCLDGGLVYRAELANDPDNPGQFVNAETDKRRYTVAKIKQSFEDAFKIPFRPTIHVFNDLMNNFFHSARYVEALECFDEIIKCELVPNLTTITLLIKSRLYLGQVEEAQRVISAMSKYGLKPSILQCALVHHALCRQLLAEEAELFLEEISSTHHIKTNYVFYASLMYAYSRRFEHVKVFKTFEKLESANFIPDTETCNYVLISLFEVGQYDQAHEFFNRMIAKGIRRNNYTYAIMADRYIIRHDPDRLMTYLEDAMLRGNTIDAFPFNKLLRFYYDHSEMTKLSETIAKMIEYSVRFNWETWQFINYVFYRALESPETLPFARQVLEKTLIDMDSTDELIKQMISNLKEVYTTLGDSEALASWDAFDARLPELREKITQISPALREDIITKEIRNASSRMRHVVEGGRFMHYRVDQPHTDEVDDGECELDGEGEDCVDLKKELDLLSYQMLQDRTADEEMSEFIKKFLSKSNDPTTTDQV